MVPLIFNFCLFPNKFGNKKFNFSLLPLKSIYYSFTEDMVLQLALTHSYQRCPN